MRRSLTLLAAILTLFAQLPAPKASGMGTEEFGNKPLNAANYTQWKGIMPVINDAARVYSIWVNGNEFFFYKGTVKDVNAALVNFASIELKTHNVILRPGPGITHTFDGKDVPHDWELHVIGGIAKHETTLDQGEKVWPKDPELTIYIGANIELEKLQLPPGVTAVDTTSRSKQVIEAISSSTDITVRGWGCGQLAMLDHFSDDNMNAVAKRLADKDNWVRLNAAGVITLFGKKAAVHLPALRECLASTDQNLKARAEESIAKIEKAQDTSDEEKNFVAAQKRIVDFVAARSKEPAKP